MTEIENIALFNLDGTLCDYDGALIAALNKLRHPSEPPAEKRIRDKEPPYIEARRNLITSSESWWANLPKFQLGFDIWKIAEELEYRRMILTQGPRGNPSAWSEKKQWIDKNLGPDTDMTITRDKGLVYGRVLVDDYPGYITKWLEWRKRGLVIMPAGKDNKNFKHPQVIRYDGSNLKQVREAMLKRKSK